MAILQVNQRSGSAASWTSSNPILQIGEIGYETDTGLFKIGDNATAWASLQYWGDFDDIRVNGNITVGGTVDGVDIAARDHDAVTLGGSLDYITITGQVLTRNPIDLATDVSNDLPFSNIAQIATNRILGRTTALTGDIEVLTPTQVTAMLDTFTATLKGLTPSSGGGTTNFLRADGTWQVPSGTGPSQLNELSDVNTSTPTNRNVLVADGVDWESRALVQADISDITATAAELNLLDLAGLTAGWVLSADSATTASWKAPAGGGGNPWTYTLQTGTTYTAAAGDFVVASNTGAVTITLPSGHSVNDTIIVKKTGSGGSVTVDGNASETIDGSTTYVMSAQYESVTLISDGTNWLIV